MKNASIVVCALILVVMIPVVLRRSFVFSVVTVVITAGVLLYNYVAFPKNIAIYDRYLFDFITVCIPLFLCAVSVRDYEALWSGMRPNMYIIAVVATATIVARLFFGLTTLKFYEYSMSLGYYSLAPMLYFLYEFFKKFNAIYLILSLILFFEVAIGGSRGPLLCFVVFASYMILKITFGKKSSLKTRISVIMVILLAIVFIIMFDWIFDSVSDWLDDLGILSRNMRLFTDGMFVSDSGREDLQGPIWAALNKEPVFGIGMGGEFLLIDTYAHSIFLSLLAHFGYIVGSVLIAIFVYFLCKSIVKTENRPLCILFFCLGVLPIFFSFSYLSSQSFWVTFGILISMIRVAEEKKQHTLGVDIRKENGYIKAEIG